MSIRLGRSRTWGRREKVLRARGEATLVVKESGLPVDWRGLAKSGGANRRTSVTSRQDVGAQPTRIAIGPPSPQATPCGVRRGLTAGTVARPGGAVKAAPGSSFPLLSAGAEAVLLDLDRGAGLFELGLDR